MTKFYVEITVNGPSPETVDCTPPDDMRAHFELMFRENGCIYVGDCPEGSYYSGGLMEIPVGRIEHGLTQRQAAEMVENGWPEHPILNELVIALESGSVENWPGPWDVAAFYALHECAIRFPPDAEMEIPY